MPESTDFGEQVKDLVRDLMHCFRHTNPSKQFLAELMLGTIHLDMLVLNMAKSRELTERRRLKQEFLAGVKTIRKGIGLLWESSRIDPAEVEQESRLLKATGSESLFPKPFPSTNE